VDTMKNSKKWLTAGLIVLLIAQAVTIHQLDEQ